MKRVWMLLLSVLVAAAVAGAPAETPHRVDSVFAEIEQVLQELEKITGLKPLRKIQYDRISRDGVRRYLEAQIHLTLKPSEIAIEEEVLKRFGLVPEDFDLKSSTVDLMSEQAAAFYDFRRKKLFLVESAAEELLHVALIHELAHALADQHYSLHRFVLGVRESDDASLARMAVMEGQATWIMSEVAARRLGLTLEKMPSMIEVVKHEAEKTASQYPTFERAPLYMRETLLFPYLQGLVFQQRVIQESGREAFRRVFTQPPVSTQQILHPEMYLTPVTPAPPRLPEAAKKRSFKLIADGTFGELDHAVLLRVHAPDIDAAAAAAAWRGAAYRLLQRKKDRSTLFVYASNWQDERAAQRFFRLYRRVLENKWKKLEPATSEPDLMTGLGDDGFFALRRNGTVVSSVEGMSGPEEVSAFVWP